MISRSSLCHDGRRAQLIVAASIIVLAAVLRLVALDRQSLWADEIFSLAMATGHSLEHPASVAQPHLGDYVEAPTPRPAVEYHRYLAHQDPPVGAHSVIRAVRLSDTSPPLYYLLLSLWTRLVGTEDGALRGFSVAWALACVPFLWSLAHEIGGRPAIAPALLLFAVSPVSLHYSTEGRMYSMVWFLALALAWLTRRLHQRGLTLLVVMAWVIVGIAGLLTHYFYVFVWLACAGWLFLYPGRCKRIWIIAAGAAVVAGIAPWYLQIPQSLSLWRVTKDWLLVPSVRSRSVAALALPWTFLRPSSGWWGQFPRAEAAAALLFLSLAAFAVWKLRWRLFGRRRQLIWLWLLAACLGPFVFDRVMGTYTTAVPRYASAGMPAAFLLVAVALGRIGPRVRALALLAIVMLWLPGSWAVLTNASRGGEAFREVAAFLDEHALEADVVIVHSIPSGVLGVSRYLSRPIPLLSWVGQLGQRRVPDDLAALDGATRLVVVKVHTVGEPAPEEDWLRAHARLRDEATLWSAQLLVFDLHDRDTTPLESRRAP